MKLTYNTITFGGVFLWRRKQLVVVSLAVLFLWTPIFRVLATEAVVDMNSASNSTKTSEQGIPTFLTDKVQQNSASEPSFLNSKENPAGPTQLELNQKSTEVSVSHGLSPEGKETKTDMSEINKNNLSLNTMASASLTPDSAQPDYSYTKNSKVTLPDSDKQSGALTFAYPIKLPPGRLNLTPDLKLTYNSQAKNFTSIYGNGWDLSFLKVSRLNKSGTENLYSENYFTSSLSGELVMVSGDSFKPKIENGDFNTYIFQNNVWVIKDKQGTQYTLGAMPESRLADSQDSSRIYAWYISEIRDTNNNFIKFEYQKNLNQIYPFRISYTGSGNTEGSFEVIFLTQPRTDDFTNYSTGFAVTTALRLSEIQIKFAGSLVKIYNLNYTIGTNSTASLLQEIVETGFNEAGVSVSLPAIHFDYQQIVPGSGWVANNDMVYPASFRQSLLFDVNGDGLTDILESWLDTNSVVHKNTYLNNGQGGWTLSTLYAPPTIFFQEQSTLTNPQDLGVRNFDINGDGFMDLQICNNVESKTWLNFGTGWQLQASGTWECKLTYAQTEGRYPQDNFAHIADLNGDGLPDIMRAYASINNPADINTWVYINNGVNGWVLDSTWSNFPLDLRWGVYMTDVNNDGLADMLQAYSDTNGNHKFTFINTGNKSWVALSAFQAPQIFYQQPSSFPNDYGARLTDVNSDGLPDVLWKLGGPGSPPGAAYINTGKGWSETIGDWDPWDSFSAINNSSDECARMADINGDGMVDQIRAYQGAYTIASYTRLNTQKPADALISIRYPAGASTEVIYQTTSQYLNGSNLLNPKFPLNSQVVKQISINDGRGSIATTSYVYEGGETYYVSKFDRGSRGFYKITQTNPVGHKNISYFHQGNINSSELGENNDHFSLIGKVFREELNSNLGNLETINLYKWENLEQSANRNFIKLTQTIIQDYDGNLSHKDKATSNFFDDTNGNLLTTTQYGEVQADSFGNFLDIGNDLKQSNFTYASGNGNYKLASETLLDQAGLKVKETRSYYDGLNLGQMTLGNLTKVENWVSGSNYINKQNLYNSLGLVTQIQDERSKVTALSYDAYNLYPASIINPLNQSSQYTYDYSSGQIQSQIDANSLTRQKIYDGLDRLIRVAQSDSINPINLVDVETYSYTYLPIGVQIQKNLFLDANNFVKQIVYTDGLERVIQNRLEAENTNDFSVTDFTYTLTGQPASESIPYFSQGTDQTALNTNPNLFNVFTYDAQGRRIKTENSIGITTVGYDNWSENITDPRGKIKILTKDAYNNLIRVDEINNGQTYSTNYLYNGLNLLSKIIDASGNIRNFQYDGLGRKLLTEDLHSPQDLTFGVFQYTYDPAGNLLSLQDPRGIVVTYSYDNLNRKLTEDASSGAGVEVTSNYDSCLLGKGYICSSTVAGSASTSYTYSVFGKIASEVVVLDGQNFTTSFQYDRQGNVTLITYPDNLQVSYGYNSAGQPETVSYKNSGETNFQEFITNTAYGPHGLLTQQVRNNGVTVNNVYDSSKLYRLIGKTTTNSGGLYLQHLAYEYDPSNNITKIIDSSNTNSAKTVNFVYDDLNRVINANSTGAINGQNYSESYTYDPLGNLTYKSGQGIYSYEGNIGTNYANAHAVTKIVDGQNVQNFEYDSAGNLINNNNRSFVWDWAGRLTQASITSGTGSTGNQNYFPTSGDGSIYYSNSNWATTRTAAAGTQASATATTFTVGSSKASNKYRIDRGFLSFDTSSLPDNATVTSAKLKLFVTAKANNDNDGDDWLTIVQGMQPSAKTLTASDYDLAGLINGPVEGIDSSERKDITNVGTNAQVIFNLNQNGKNWISKIGVTKFALREGHDVLNSVFVGSNGQANKLVMSSGEYSGTAKDPVLEIVYTLPSPQSVYTYAYNNEGQRVKISDGTITTLYPNKYFNLTGGKLVKHIWGLNETLATIETSGGVNKFYHLFADHLQSNTLATNISGGVEELLDYYPYGEMRLDEKTSGFSEQRKYIGQEYDNFTALNYLNARYYNSAFARFVSQDPMVASLETCELLKDPQMLNSYSYARNNPLSFTDKSGLLSIYVHGTWADSAGMKNGEMMPFIEKSFGESVKMFNWNGFDNHSARQYAAENLANTINNHSFSEGERLNLVGHSHGGNVAILASQLIHKKIDNLITLGTPVRNEYKPNYEMIDNHINAYSWFDPVQINGGGEFALGNFRAVYNMSKGVVGLNIKKFLQGYTQIGTGEFGVAGRKYKNADYNLNASGYSSINLNVINNLKNPHSDMWRNPGIWTGLISGKLK